MATHFWKMHGLGNDFAIFDARTSDVPMPPERVRRLADRHFGIGCDQLIRLEASARADVFMRIYNPDGSESGACGNATRCVAKLLGGDARIETEAGILIARSGADGVTVNMGRPGFAWQQIPLARAMPTHPLPQTWHELPPPDAISMGNPHVVFFVDDVDAVPLGEWGPEIECDPLFPERTNVNMAQIVGRNQIRLRVWERGAGLTLACGSGACATFAAARQRALVGTQAVVSLPGGELSLEEAVDGAILMTGPAAISFSGDTAL